MKILIHASSGKDRTFFWASNCSASLVAIASLLPFSMLLGLFSINFTMIDFFAYKLDSRLSLDQKEILSSLSCFSSIMSICAALVIFISNLDLYPLRSILFILPYIFLIAMAAYSFNNDIAEWSDKKLQKSSIIVFLVSLALSVLLISISL